ncbi:MAG: HPP family protein [Wohlfahrtiimonas sp.]
MKRYYDKVMVCSLAGLGSAICITLLAYLSAYEQVLLLMAPFGATMVILFALPESPLAQPKNIIAGHILTAGIGILILYSCGNNPVSMGSAVGLAVLIMMLTNTIHPPAGANPLVVIWAGEDWGFMMMPVMAGAVMIVLFGYVYHKYISHRQYPTKKHIS